MARWGFTTRRNPKNIYMGNCFMHIYKEMLDDDSFKHIFRKSKSEVPNCDVKDRNVPKRQQEVPTSARPAILESASGKSFPKADVLVSVSTDAPVSSCANHAQLFEDSQLRSLYNLGNIRGGELNPNEPEDAKYRLKKREEDFKAKSKAAWDATVRERSQSRFNSGLAPDVNNLVTDK